MRSWELKGYGTVLNFLIISYYLRYFKLFDAVPFFLGGSHIEFSTWCTIVLNWYAMF